MDYNEFVELYERISRTTKKLEKVEIIAHFFINFKGNNEWIYLLKGKVLPDYDSREIGISDQLVMKAISISYGLKLRDVQESFNKTGDWGDVAFEFSGKRKQGVLFSNKLKVDKVYNNILNIVYTEGFGAIDKKMKLIAELLSNASGNEAKYIIRTLLGDLRIGVADALIVDSLNKAFFNSEEKDLLEEKYDLCNDLSLLFDSCKKGKKGLEKIDIVPGRPMKVMLPVKVLDFEEAFRICGMPAAIEHKYDGFRMIINKQKGKINLFTRRLENVTEQFPDVVSVVERDISAESFIIDTEVVGYNPKTKKYMPFESISQRIKRKYDIDKLVEELPVEINVFDIVFFNGKNLMSLPFQERRKIIEKVVRERYFVIRPAKQLIVNDIDSAREFYNDALKIGEEGIMVKKLDAPYKQGRKIGYMVKLKPIIQDLDLVIIGAEYGTGKRAGWFTSFIVGCRDDNDEIVELGMVSSGLKEKEDEGTSYEDMTKLLKPLIIKEEGNLVRVKPKIVISVTYQNIQKSPSYSSGYALRFPRITFYRPDRSLYDIASIKDIEREVKKQR
jgi:DNA ligase-1